MDQLSFADIFKKSFIAMGSKVEHYSALEIVMNLGFSFIIGLFIFYIYKKTFQGVLYQRSFNTSLITITMVITLIIMTIAGNLILSLGMVGALSIVRFRTPIKDPVDLVFIFWAISAGIANGVGYYNLSIIGSIVLSLALLFMARKEQTEHPYLLVVQSNNDIDDATLYAQIKQSVDNFRLKSKTINADYTEYTAEIRLKKEDTQFISDLHKNNTIIKATLISYSGDLAQV